MRNPTWKCTAWILVVSLIFAACGQTKSSTNAPANRTPTPSSDEPWSLEKAAAPYKGQRISFWTPTWKDGLDKVAADFKAKTGIEVEVTAMPNQQLFDKFILDVKTGQGAFDASLANTSLIATALKGLEGLTELSDLMKNKQLADPNWEKDDLVWERTMGKASGKIHGIPMNSGGLFLYYRTDLFRDPKHRASFKEKYGYELSPPVTIKEFGDISTYFTETEWKAEDGTKGYGIAHFGKKDEGLFWEFELYLNGLINESGSKAYLQIYPGFKPNLTSDLAVKALEFYKGNLKNSPPGVAEVGNTENRTLFAQGKVAMVITFLSFLTVSHNPEKSKVADRVALAQVPGHRGRLGGWHGVINKASKNQEAAFLWLQYLSSKEVNWQLNELVSFGLNRYSNWTDPRFLQKYPYREVFEATYREGMPFPTLPEYQSLHKAFGDEVSAYFSTPRGDARSTLAKIDGLWTQILKEAGY